MRIAGPWACAAREGRAGQPLRAGRGVSGWGSRSAGSWMGGMSRRTASPVPSRPGPRRPRPGARWLAEGQGPVRRSLRPAEDVDRREAGMRARLREAPRPRLRSDRLSGMPRRTAWTPAERAMGGQGAAHGRGSGSGSCGAGWRSRRAGAPGGSGRALGAPDLHDVALPKAQGLLAVQVSPRMGRLHPDGDAGPDGEQGAGRGWGEGVMASRDPGAGWAAGRGGGGAARVATMRPSPG